MNCGTARAEGLFSRNSGVKNKTSECRTASGGERGAEMNLPHETEYIMREEQKQMESEKKPENVENCYGTLRLTKSAGGVFRGDCHHNECPWRRACVSRSREEMELREFRLMTVPLEDKLNRLDDILSTSGPEASADWLMERLGLTEEESQQLRDVIEILAMVYFQLPNVFHFAMRKIFHGESQADIARAKKVSREIVSRKGLADLAGIKNPAIHLPPELEGMEKLVYDACFLRKLSIRKAAEELKMSKDKVYRVRQKISTKLTKSATSKSKGRLKK